MKYAIVTLAGSLLMGFTILADAVRERYAPTDAVLTIGGVVLLIGIIGIIIERKSK